MNSEKFRRRIIEDTGLSRKEINVIMNEMRAKLKEKISEELALCIIAKELAVTVERDKDKRLDEWIYTGVKNLSQSTKILVAIEQFLKKGQDPNN